MKKLIFFLPLIVIILTISCKKNTSDNSTPSTGAPLVFTSLVAEHDTIAINTTMKIKATASGDGITYTWTESYEGTITPLMTDPSVLNFSICHPSTFTVTCVVKDKNNSSLSKTVKIVVYKPAL
jgi:hypothetical protein